MIKNFLYSIFLHCLILSLIYFSFINFETLDVGESQEFSAEIVGNISENFFSTKPIDQKPLKPENSNSKDEKKNSKISNKEILTSENNINQDDLESDKLLSSQPKTTDNNIDKKITKFENLVKTQVGKKKAPTLEDSGLSSREKLNILTQLKACYHHAIQENGQRSNYGLIIQVNISIDGYIDGNFDSVTDLKKYNDPQNNDYKIMINNAKKALDLCSPLRNLPQDKYNIWKEIIVKFDSE